MPPSSTLTNGTGSTATSSLLAPPTGNDLRDAAKRVVDGFDPDMDIHQLLQGVRLDEIVTLAQSPHALHTVKEDSSFPANFYIPLQRYISYLYETWSNIVKLTIEHDIPFTDWVLSVVFAALTSFILFFALIWCQLANFPPFYNLYYAWSSKNAHGLGLVNAADPTLFNALTTQQVKAAKKKLGQPIDDCVRPKDTRVFDLDIAKFFLQLASIVYEHAPISIHETLEEVTNAHRTRPPKHAHTSAACSSARRCTVHRPADASPNSPAHSPSPGASAPRTPGGTLIDSMPGKLVHDIWDKDTADKITKAFKTAVSSHGRSVIVDFCKRMEIDYEPVSELNNSNSAYCSFFWDNKSNWIVVTFKGTGAVEYADWVTDLTTSLGDVSDFLPGYGKAINGFKERLYPSKVSTLGGTRPWDSIRYSLCKVAEKLAYNRAQEGYTDKINVWFTGHSLGCALATLAYTRAISTPSDFAGYPIEIRDCIIFAAPVSANRDTAVKFNEAMAKADAEYGPNVHARTLWRIRNAGDAVATLLPQLGDRADLVGKLSPTNPAGFAHLGAEIFMQDGPSACQVISPNAHLGGSPSDYDATPNPIRVEIHSEFTKGEIEAQREARLAQTGEKEREAFFKWAEQIPLIGRFAAHDTVLYWDQLDRIALSSCKWASS